MERPLSNVDLPTLERPTKATCGAHAACVHVLVCVECARVNVCEALVISCTHGASYVGGDTSGTPSVGNSSVLRALLTGWKREANSLSITPAVASIRVFQEPTRRTVALGGLEILPVYLFSTSN
jgi:hypothetical protein